MLCKDISESLWVVSITLTTESIYALQDPRFSERIMCTTPMMTNFFHCGPARAEECSCEWGYQLRSFFCRLFWVCVLQPQGRIKLDTVLWGESRQQQFGVGSDFWNTLFAKDTDAYLLELIKREIFLQVCAVEKFYCGNELCYFRTYFCNNITFN